VTNKNIYGIIYINYYQRVSSLGKCNQELYIHMTLHTPHGLEGDHNDHVATTQPEAPAKKNGRGRVIGAIGTTVALLVGGGTALMSAEKGGHKAPAVAASEATV
jgi:hypothetical protein